MVIALLVAVAIALDGEMTWLLPAAPRPYRRGPIEQVDYAFAR